MMNRNNSFTKKMLGIVALAFFSGALITIFKAGAHAKSKKDVSDPALQEIISAFDSKMPRFINQHGQDIFVEDGSVTRGSMISALYEYDRSLKYATKQDFAELKDKLASTEKDSAYNIQKIAVDIQPWMGGILDKSLNNSKVFSDLAKKQALNVQQEAINKTVNSNVTELGARIDRLEKTLMPGPDAAGQEQGLKALENRLKSLEEKIAKKEKLPLSEEAQAKLLKRVEELELSFSKNQLSGQGVSRLEEKVSQLDRSLNSEKLYTASGQQELVRRVNALEKLESEKIDLAQLQKSVSRLEAKFENQKEPFKATKNDEITELVTRIERLEGSGVPRTSVSAAEIQRIEKRIENIEKNLGSRVSEGGLSPDNEKRLRNVDVLAEQYKMLEEKLDRIDDRISNAPSQSASSVSSASRAGGDYPEINKRLEKVERIVPIYMNFEKEISRLEARINGVERISSLGNLTASDELSDLAKRVNELERIISRSNGSAGKN